MVEIKICGITKLVEIQYINLLKPDYIGFVFAESKRKITKQQSISLIGALDKGIKKVAVFRNNQIEEVLDIVRNVPIDVIQLHGKENEEYIRKLKIALGNKIDIWKAIGVNSDTKFQEYNVDALVLDNINAGSGQVFPWEIIENHNFNKSIFLAGGINEENVVQGIKAINTKGIDVSSGVEIINENGEIIKSFNKMENLIRKVRAI